MTTALQLLALAAIILWNAFFVAAEYAFVSSRPTRLREMADQGRKGAERVIALQENPTQFISAVQLAITMSSLAAGAVGEPVLRRIIGDVLEGIAGRSLTVLSVIIGFSVVTAITVVLGEIVPKTMSLQRSEPIAVFAARPVMLFAVVLRPFIWVLEKLSGITLRAMGLPSAVRIGRTHSEEELKLMVAASFEEGVLEADEQAMLARVFDFAETEAQQVMVPRPDVIALPITATVAEATALALRHPYNRYPVYGEDMDDVRGVVHVRQLFEAARAAGSGDRDIGPLVRPVQMVPETKRSDELLREFRRTKSHLAVVVDEYGQLAGVVTLEDLLEEIVGEIADEFDVPNEDVVRIDDRRCLVNASFALEDFNERFGTDYDTDDFNSVGGAVFDALGRVPHVGDRVALDGADFIVREMDGSRITLLEVVLPSRTHADDSPAPLPEAGTP